MIIIPMAGLSSRFFQEGFTKPKYMLEAHGKTLFEHSLNSFENYFGSDNFLFIIRDVYDTKKFVEQQCQILGIVNYEIHVLRKETRGQAETVSIALRHNPYTGPITIFNIDTFRPKFSFPTFRDVGAGYIEVFKGTGNNWSFAVAESATSNKVIKTSEKNRISDLCSTGLYFFSNTKKFMDSFDHYLSLPQSEWEQGELYIAPLYNYLIEKGEVIYYNLIEKNKVIFCGTPSEYYEFLKMNEQSSA
ncbi:MAG: dTDP-glucose pyrophosphorylase [Mariniflexile sp.]|jgi:dTDP-glucose pyrophosphorylase